MATDRTMTSAMESALEGFEHVLVTFIEMEFSTGTLRLWNGIGDFDWDSKTWTGAGDLMAFSAVKESLDRRVGEVTGRLSGVDSAIISLAENDDFQGRGMSVWLAELDSSGSVIADPIKIFKGRMDTMVTVDQGDTATVELTAVSKSVDQERPNRRDYTEEDQALDYTGDKGFEFMAELQDSRIVWGPGGESGASKLR